MDKSSLSRRLLQLAVSLSAFQAIVGGGLHLWMGFGAIELITKAPLEFDPANPAWGRVDYMFRAMAGVWLALGLMLACIVPSVERHSAWFGLCLAGIFAMGVGRLISGIEFGPDPANSRAAMIAELITPGILLLWHRSVAKAHLITSKLPSP